VVAVCPFRQCPDVGVRGFGPGVGDVVVECVRDQRAVSFDCAAELFELYDATVASPEDPAGQQGMALGAFAAEHFPELRPSWAHTIRPVS